MKKTIYLMGLCLLTFACKQDPNQLILTGTGISTTGDIYVYDVSENRPLDTIKITDGSFVYTREITGDSKLLVITDNSTMIHYLITEKGNLSLNGDTSVIKGTPLNDRMADLIHVYRNTGRDLEEKKNALILSTEKEGKELTQEQILELQVLDKKQSSIVGKAIKEYYEKDKGTILGVFELTLLQSLVSEEEFIFLFRQGGEEAKNFLPFVKMFEVEANKEKTKSGYKYIDFQGVNPKDTTQTIKLSDFVGKNKYILLDFWASWCGPCREAIREIKLLNDKYSNKGLEVIGMVVNDEIKNHLQAVDVLKVSWTQIFDNKNELVSLYGIEGVPTLILLDKDGTILVRTHEKDEIFEKIKSLLGK
jgi:thiol-disulfide isomerase/thioredoxin